MIAQMLMNHGTCSGAHGRSAGSLALAEALDAGEFPGSAGAGGRNCVTSSTAGAGGPV